MALQIGSLLSERYRLTRVLGQGGMGAVYLAVDESLGVPCAVKENLNFSPETERLFRREATLLAALRHPNLPRVTNHFVLGSQQYLVMDYVEGEDLKARLERQGPLPETLVVAWGAQLSDALAYLHGLTPPIIHRDIKPANIKLTPTGEIFLVDFGVAKPTSSDQKTATNTMAFTPGFTPPEQYGLGRLDARADQYALGATLYILLTGQAPPDSVERLLGNAALAPLQTLRPGVSSNVAEAITRALEIQPDDRFANVSAFKQALSSPPQSRPPATLMERGLLGGPAVGGETVVHGGRKAPPEGGPTLRAPTGVAPLPPPTLMERAAFPLAESPPHSPPTLMEGVGSHLPAGPPPLGPPALPPTAAMPIPEPVAAPAPARRRPRWLMLAGIGCLVVVLGVAALAGGSALGLALGQRATPSPTVTEPVVDPATATVPVIVEATNTEPAPPSATATPEEPTTAPTDADTPAPEVSPTDTETEVPSETPTAEGTPIGSGGRLAFISDRDGQFFQIYTMNANGSDVQQVTTDPTDKWSPDWDFNGTQLAWTSDGTRLIYVADGGGSNGLDLWIINADGSEPQNITNAAGDDFQPSWCGDDQLWWASTRVNGVHQIFGSTLADLASGFRPFNFSGTHNNPREFDPDAYPGCERLVFTSTLDGVNEIWRYWPDCEECYRKVRTYKDQNGRAEEPALSPDGTLMAYTRVLPESTEIVVADVDDRTTNVQLTSSLNNFSAHWSPDGQWLTFVSLRDGNREIYVMTVAGTSQTNLTLNTATDTDPVCQP
jgi:serine/threonine protein kinase